MKISTFDGENYYLSNFFYSPFEFDGVLYPTVEHAFQAAKAIDREERDMITAAATPGIAKKLGRQCRVRKDWNQVRVMVMAQLLHAKFSQHTVLREKLLATGDAILEEGNTWGDKFWGKVAGVGENNLGNLLMLLRDTFRNQCAPTDTSEKAGAQ